MLPYEKRAKERTMLIKKEAESSLTYGSSPYNRSVKELLSAGVINVNKPKGPTSHEVSEFVKDILHVKKAGQSGTLDPAVTGVLPVGIEKGTKALQAVLKAGKEYVCLMHLHDDYTPEQIRSTCANFVGLIKQLPPIKSAVKRQYRFRRIYYLDILEIKGREVLFTVGCQAGTYIRKLCVDIGEALGSSAHMAQLVRTRVGNFVLENSYTLQDISDAFRLYKESTDETTLRKVLLPIEEIVSHLPKVYVFDSVVRYICNGSNLAIPGLSKLDSDIEPDELVAVMSLKGELIALGFALCNSTVMFTEKEGLCVKVEFVLMDPLTYPKLSSKE